MRNVLRFMAPAVVALAILAPEGSQAQGVNPRCDAYAREAAASQADGGEVLGGAVAGAIGGALLGGLAGGRRGAGTGALIGTGVGAFGGAANNQNRQNAAYWYAYNDCMSRGAPRAQAAYDAYEEAPEPWSEDWYDYCTSKYRSFNARTGMYLASSGQYKLCR